MCARNLSFIKGGYFQNLFEFLRTLFSYMFPIIQDPMEDIYNGLNLFEKLFSSPYKLPVDQHQKDMHFQAISLLQNLSDMLALKVEEQQLSVSLSDCFIIT